MSVFRSIALLLLVVSPILASGDDLRPRPYFGCEVYLSPAEDFVSLVKESEQYRAEVATGFDQRDIRVAMNPRLSTMLQWMRDNIQKWIDNHELVDLTLESEIPPETAGVFKPTEDLKFFMQEIEELSKKKFIYPHQLNALGYVFSQISTLQKYIFAQRRSTFGSKSASLIATELNAVINYYRGSCFDRASFRSRVEEEQRQGRTKYNNTEGEAARYLIVTQHLLSIDDINLATVENIDLISLTTTITTGDGHDWSPAAEYWHDRFNHAGKYKDDENEYSPQLPLLKRRKFYTAFLEWASRSETDFHNNLILRLMWFDVFRENGRPIFPTTLIRNIDITVRNMPGRLSDPKDFGAGFVGHPVSVEQVKALGASLKAFATEWQKQN